jgi:hypothetical protein
MELAISSSTAPAKTPAKSTIRATAPACPCWWNWWSCPQPSPGEQIRSHRIKHGTDRNHDQGNDAGPPLLVELATGSNTAPATITTRATTPARRRWWSWPPDRAQQRPRRQHRPALAGGAGHCIEQGDSHDQGDSTGTLLLLDLVKLATASRTAPAKALTVTTTKAIAPARPCWWSS